jgi:Predicted phage phi-C31 gp36 major capsid-like protein
MILGIPVVPDFDHMADIANDSLSIFVGNLNQAYQIVDRRGVNVIRDNITNPDVVKWYFQNVQVAMLLTPKPSVSSNLKLNKGAENEYK